MAESEQLAISGTKPRQCGSELATVFGHVRCEREARHASVWHRGKPMPGGEARWLSLGSYEISYPTRAVS